MASNGTSKRSKRCPSRTVGISPRAAHVRGVREMPSMSAAFSTVIVNRLSMAASLPVIVAVTSSCLRNANS